MMNPRVIKAGDPMPTHRIAAARDTGLSSSQVRAVTLMKASARGLGSFEMGTAAGIDVDKPVCDQE